MNRCVAVKRKGSTDPCPAAALAGHTLCGRHARMRSPIVWTEVNQSRIQPIVKMQSCVRGWLVRRRLSYAGPGVLCRSNLTNDEDIITCAEKGRVHPMEFFSFEENGKVWWFEFSSLWTWCTRNLDPTNPYTKVPLSSEARKRLRTVWGYKRRHREETPTESKDLEERMRHRAHLLVQHFEDYGFSGIHPSFILRLTKADFTTVFVLLQRDIETVIPASDPFRARIVSLCHARTFPNVTHLLNYSSTLLYILTLYRDPYILTFSILSALYRA